MAGAVIILLHTLRARRRPYVVSSLFLWERVERTLAADYRRRRFTKSLLLLVQLLIVAVLSTGLADPRPRLQRPPFHLAIVVDTSASMAVGPGESRATVARASIERFLSEGEADRYLLWSTTGDHLLYDGPEKGELLARLSALPPPAGSSAWEELHRLMTARLSDDVPVHVVIVSDGAVAPDTLMPFLSLGPGTRLSLIDVGTPVDNLGITRFSARPSGRGEGHHQILLEVENFGEEQATPLVSVAAFPAPGSLQDQTGGLLLFESTVTLAPGGRERIVLDHSLGPGYSLEARLASTDPFPVDDAAYLVVGSQSATRVLVVGEESRFLHQGFAAFPNVETVHAYLPSAALDPNVSYDLVVFLDEEVPADFQGTALVVTSGSALREAYPATVTWWDRRHPFSRFVDWESVSIAMAEPLTPLPTEIVLLQSTAGPLLTLLDEPERRIIRLAIPLFQSDLPFRIAFPVFLQNVVEWVNPSAQESVPHPVQPGRLPAAVLKAWNEGEALTLAQPSGEVHHLESGDRELSREAHAWVMEPGVYRWWAETGEGSFAVSLLDREESNLNSRWAEALIQGGATFLNLDRDRLADLVPEASIRRDAPPASQTERLWRWIGLLSIILLLLEGRLYTARHGGHVAEPELLSGAPAVARGPARRARGVPKPSRGGRLRWRWG